MISLARETVSRLLADFSREGLLSRDGGRLIVHQRPALEALTRGLDAG